MQNNNPHSWRHGGRRADGRCIACSQLMTLSSVCTCWSLPVTNDALQYRQDSDDQSPDLHDDDESTDASQKSSLLSAHSDDETAASCSSRRVSSVEFTASCDTSAEECVVVDEMESSRQSSLLSDVGEQSGDGHSVECCKTHQLFSEHHNRQYLDVQQVSSNESLLSAKGSDSDNDGCRLISGACQSTTIGSDSSSRQFSLLSTDREQSLDSHSTKGYCRFHQWCCASRPCDNRQHINQPVRQVSSGEVSLLSAKGSNTNNDDWRVNDACQFNGVEYCEITTQKSLSQCSLLDKGTTKKHHAKVDQDFNVSRVQNNGQHLGVRQASSSEVSLLSATGSSPNNDDCRLMTYAYQYNGIGSCKIVGRESLRQSSLFSAVGESPNTGKNNSKGHKRFNASSAQGYQQHRRVREVSFSVKGQTPNSNVKQNKINNAYESMADGSDSNLNAHTIEEPSSAGQIKTHRDELNVNDSHDNRRQHSNRLKADESSDTMSTFSQSTVSSTDASLIDAKRSTPNTQGRTSMTENWNKTCNCRRVKFRTTSKPKTQSSDVSKLNVNFETDQKNEISGECDTDEKSNTAERLLQDGNVACYCGGQCALHNTRRITPCNCQTCLSTYYNWTSNIEDTAGDTGASRTESLVTSDNASRTSVTTSCSVSRTSVSDADVDDKSQCGSTAEEVRDEGEVSGQTVLCPNCFRNNHYVQTTRNEVENDSESTDESEVSENNDNQDDEQKSTTDGQRGDSCSDTADRRGQAARTDSQMSTSIKSDVTSRRESRVSTEARNVGSHKCCHCQWQHVAVSKWRNDDGVMATVDRDAGRTDSRTTAVTTSSYSRSNKELDVSDSEHVDDDDDDDDDENQSVNEQCTVCCKHVEVTSISNFLHFCL